MASLDVALKNNLPNSFSALLPVINKPPSDQIGDVELNHLKSCS